MIGPLGRNGMSRETWRLPGRVRALAWSADGSALFAATPEAGTIHQLERGRAAPRLLSRLPAGSGQPVALATDIEGGLWTALRDGWSVARLSQNGDIETVLPLPVPRPTGLAFGGPDLRTLFVATARDGVALEVLASAPLSGSLLALETCVSGSPAAEVRDV